MTRARTLLVARHGQTDWNLLGRFQGQTDIRLNDDGRAQAEALAARLAGRPLGAVASSDLVRARETADIVARRLGVPSGHVDADLRERRYGAFEGLTRTECESRYPDAWTAWLERRVDPPQGEPHAAFVERLVRGFARVARTVAVEHDAVLVVSHGGAIRTFVEVIVGHGVPAVPNAGVFEIHFDGARFLDARLL
jgi:probable phosphoglycerate mutase